MPSLSWLFVARSIREQVLEVLKRPEVDTREDCRLLLSRLPVAMSTIRDGSADYIKLLDSFRRNMLDTTATKSSTIHRTTTILTEWLTTSLVF